MSRSWLFLTIPVAIVAIALLALAARSLIRTVRAAVVATVPVRAEQQLVIGSDGDFALDLEAPLLGRVPTTMRFYLSHSASQSPVTLYPIAFRTEVSSMSRARLELYSFRLPAPGTYTLRIDGIDPSVDYSRHAVLITRRYVGALVLHVLALVALGVVLIGMMVISGLVLK
jgi:hypothetical protein